MTTTQTYKPVGRLDGSNAAAHEKELRELLVDDVHSVNIDLSELDYVSSAGLRVLLMTAKAAKAKGGKVVLLAPKPAILEVIKISGFDRILEVQA
jgi:anti-anti-sigma factor